MWLLLLHFVMVICKFIPSFFSFNHLHIWKLRLTKFRTSPSSRKNSHATQSGTHASAHSGYNSLNTAHCSLSTHKPSIATCTTSINENDNSFSSSAPTYHDPDAISPVPRIYSPQLTSHISEITPNAGQHLALPPPTSRGMWGIFRTHIHPLPINSLFSHDKRTSGGSGIHHSRTKSQSQSHHQSNIANEKAPALTPPSSNTTTTQIWSADDTHKSSNAGLLVPGNRGVDDDVYDQDDILASPKPGTRAYRERERREMIAEREVRKRERERKKSEGERQGEGLNVKREFEVEIMEEKQNGNIGQAESS